MKDRDKIQLLRAFMQIGHSDGKDFDSASVTLHGRPFDLYPMKEVREMVEELTLAVITGAELSVTQKFAYWMLKDSGVIEGFAELGLIGEEIARLKGNL